MREIGTVTENLGRVARVRIERPAMCAGCSGCIELGGSSQRLIEAENGIGAAVGERVECEIPARQLLSHSFFVFVLPLLFMVAGYILAARSAGPLPAAAEGRGIAGAFAGLLVAYALIRLIDRWWSRRHAAVARITGRAPLDGDARLPVCPSPAIFHGTTR